MTTPPLERRPAASRLARVLIVAYCLLAIAWLMASPPFGALDEGAHYTRAVGLAGGELVGAKTAYSAREMPSLSPPKLAWVNRATRRVTVPAGLAAAGAECVPQNRLSSAACLDEAKPWPGPVEAKTYVGAYHPLPYVLPGAAARTAGNWQSALRRGRIAAGATFLLLAAAGILALASADRTGVALAGPLLALPPAMLFVGSTLNPNGLEAAAGFAFASALLPLVRGLGRPATLWPCALGAGVVLVMSRQTGPAWLAMILAVAIGLGGARGTRAALAAGRGWAIATAVALSAAVALNRAWERRHLGDTPISLSPARASLEEGLGLLPDMLADVVGVFGANAVRMPAVLYLLWAAALLAVSTLALLSGTARERATVAAVCTAAIVVPVVFHAASYRHTGFDPAGRYFLGVYPAFPILIATVVAANMARLQTLDVRRLLAVVGLVAAGTHAVGWYAAARAAAVGLDGPLFFPPQAEWSPPLGWWPWILCTAAGAALIGAAPFVLPSRQPRPEGQYVVVRPLG